MEVARKKLNICLTKSIFNAYFFVSCLKRFATTLGKVSGHSECNLGSFGAVKNAPIFALFSQKFYESGRL